MAPNSEASLDEVVTFLCGELRVSHIEGEEAAERRARSRRLANWYRLNRCLIDADYCPGFLDNLSEVQYHSFRILREWWTAKYQDAATAVVWSLHLSKDVDEIGYESDDDQRALRDVLRSLQVREWPPNDIHTVAEDPSETACKDQGYSNVVFDLMNAELKWIDEIYRWGPYRLGQVRECRFKAFQWAYCQQFAIDNLCFARDSLEKDKSSMNSSVGLFNERESAVADLYGEKVPKQPLDDWSTQKGPPEAWWIRQRPISHSEGLNESPRYLYDREERRTVDVATLQARPSYTAISHTWGRWRIGEPVKLDGVPWLVPQNSVFDITAFVDDLNRLPCDTRYLWFDLLCIPQDRSSLAEKEIAHQAQIFRNAKHAIAWLHDVDDLECLGKVLTYLALDLLQLPSDSEEAVARDRLQLELLNAMRLQKTNLLHVVDEAHARKVLGSHGEGTDGPEVWFTSLWTLQEVCLRPDMGICSSSCKLLRSVNGDPIPFNALCGIWYCMSNDAEMRQLNATMKMVFMYAPAWKYYLLSSQTRQQLRRFRKSRPKEPSKVWGSLEAAVRQRVGLSKQPTDEPTAVNDLAVCRGFWELSAWAEATGLADLPQLAPAGVLALGERRHCKHSRAEAIMSALGTTEWYTKMSAEARENNLVLGKYPLPFLRELQDRHPSQFFGSAGHNGPLKAPEPELGEFVALPEQNTVPMHGSMLPFGPWTKIAQRPTTYNLLPSHESLRGWTVNPDGSVHIPRACVLASSTKRNIAKTSEPLPAMLRGFYTNKVPLLDGRILEVSPYAQNPELTTTSTDLEAWIASREYEAHAVVLTGSLEYKNAQGMSYEFRPNVSGNILVKAEGHLDRLFCVGYFAVNHSSTKWWLPEAIEVNWTVA